MGQTDFDTYWSEVDGEEHEELSRSTCAACGEFQGDCDCTPADVDRFYDALRVRLAPVQP